MNSFSSLAESRAASPREPLYDFNELAAKFGVTVRALSALRRDNPTLKPFRGNKYRLSDAQAWFDEVKGGL